MWGLAIACTTRSAATASSSCSSAATSPRKVKTLPEPSGSHKCTESSSMTTTAHRKSSKPKTSTYDVAEHLRTPEEMAAYLDAWLEEAPDDVSGIARALGDIARAKGMSQVAKEAGLSRESLYRALSEGGNPSFATVLKVARALGVRLHAEPA